MIKKIAALLVLLLLITGLTFILGPKVKTAQLNSSNPPKILSLDVVERAVFNQDSQLPIKPENESKIIWADTDRKSKTPYSVVYLHGFSASPEEGAPLHIDFAKRYGFNLYIPRLSEHGLDVAEPLLDFTAEGYLESVKKAINIGKSIGDQVILIACSTGATAGLYLAADDKKISSLILIAPNIYLANPASSLITGPWGKSILKKILGGNYQQWDATDEVKKYWYTKYRLEGLVELMRLIDATMTPTTFHQIDQPLFAGYYYKNEEEQDDVVSVPAILDMYDQLSTPEHKKRKVAFPDAKTHVISSPLMNPNYQRVLNEVFDFAEHILGLSPLEKRKPIESTQDVQLIEH